MEWIAHVNRDQDGCGKQLHTDLGKEEREWKGQRYGALRV